MAMLNNQRVISKIKLSSFDLRGSVRGSGNRGGLGQWKNFSQVRWCSRAMPRFPSYSCHVFFAQEAMPDSIRGTFAHDTSPNWLGIFLVTRHERRSHLQLTQWQTATVTIPSPSHHKIMVDRLNHLQSWYPLVNVYITMERSTIFNG